MAHRIARLRDIAALVIGYPLLAHYTNESAHGGNLGAAVLAFRNTSALPR